MLPVVIVVNLALGFFLGKFHERIEWNNLIREGIIPKPNRHKGP